MSPIWCVAYPQLEKTYLYGTQHRLHFHTRCGMFTQNHPWNVLKCTDIIHLRGQFCVHIPFQQILFKPKHLLPELHIVALFASSKDMNLAHVPHNLFFDIYWIFNTFTDILFHKIRYQYLRQYMQSMNENQLLLLDFCNITWEQVVLSPSNHNQNKG